MSVSNTRLASALLGVATLLSGADVASAGSTRNWTGAWIGFGAGYASGNASGQLRKSEGCFISSMSKGASGVSSNCTVGNGEATAATGFGISNIDAVAAVSNQSQASTSGMRSFTLSDIQAYDNSIPSISYASSIVEANASSPGITVATSSATASHMGVTADGNAIAVSNGTTQTSDESFTDILGPAPYSGAVTTNGIAAANAITGLYGAASHSSGEHETIRAEAVAIGFGGLPQGDLSGSDGGLSPDIHLRYDYQTAVNVIVGAEFDVAMPTGEGVDQSSRISIDPSALLTVERGYQAQADALMSARLRLGYAVGDYMAYATGGLAYTNFTATAYTTASYDGQNLTEASSKSDDAFGAVVGGGVSKFVADNATISLEGLYYAFDKDIEFGQSTGKTTVELEDAFSVMMKFSIRVN